jgi:hypothetical protein
LKPCPALEGPDATRIAAAWANWFEGPTMKVSKERFSSGAGLRASACSALAGR